MGRLIINSPRQAAWRSLGEAYRSGIWRLRRWGRLGTHEWGWTGWFSFGIGVVALMLFVAAWRLQKSIPAIETQLQLQRASSADIASNTAGPSTADKLADFYQHLVAFEAIPQVVQDLIRSAEDQGLSLQRGDYRPQAEPAGRYLRYHMDLPVEGEQAAILRFVQSALLAQPALALHSIQFKREHIDSSTLQARLQWTIFARISVGETATSTTSPGGAR